MLKQRDVVLVYDRLPPTGREEKHPVVILSCSRAINFQQSFIGIMMTSSSNYDDAFSYFVTDDMFERPLKKQGCQLRLHLISNFMMHDLDPSVVQPVNRMNMFDFEALLDEVFHVALKIDKNP